MLALLLAQLPHAPATPEVAQHVLRIDGAGVVFQGQAISPDLVLDEAESAVLWTALRSVRERALEESGRTGLPVSLGALVLEVDPHVPSGEVQPWLQAIREAEFTHVQVAMETKGGRVTQPLLLGGTTPVSSVQDEQLWVSLYLESGSCKLVVAPFPAPDRPRGDFPCGSLPDFAEGVAMQPVVTLVASEGTPWQELVDQQAYVIAAGRLPALAVGLRPDWKQPGEAGRWMDQGLPRGPVYYVIAGDGGVRADGVPAEGAWVEAPYECSGTLVRAFIPAGEALGFQLGGEGQILPSHTQVCPDGQVGVWVVDPG